MITTSKIVLAITVFIWARGTLAVEQCFVYSDGTPQTSLQDSQPTTISLKPQDPKWKIKMLLSGNDKTCVSLESNGNRVNANVIDGDCKSPDQSPHVHNMKDFSQEEWTHLKITKNCSQLHLHVVGYCVFPIANDLQDLKVIFHQGLSFTFNCKDMCVYEAKPNKHKQNLTPFREFFFKPKLNFKIEVTCRTKNHIGKIVKTLKPVTKKALDLAPSDWVRVTGDVNEKWLIFNSQKKVVKIDKVEFSEPLIVHGSSFWSDCDPRQNSLHTETSVGISEASCRETSSSPQTTPTTTVLVQTTEVSTTTVKSGSSTIYIFFMILSCASVLLCLVYITKGTYDYKIAFTTLNTDPKKRDVSQQRLQIYLNVTLKFCLILLMLCLCVMILSLSITFFIQQHEHKGDSATKDLQLPNTIYIFFYIVGSASFLLHSFIGFKKIFSLLKFNEAKTQAERRASKYSSSVRSSRPRSNHQHNSGQPRDINNMASSVWDDTESLPEHVTCLTKLTQTVLKGSLLLLLLCLCIQLYSWYLSWKMLLK